jgi:hypothetical protein
MDGGLGFGEGGMHLADLAAVRGGLLPRHAGVGLGALSGAREDCMARPQPLAWYLKEGRRCSARAPR